MGWVIRNTLGQYVSGIKDKEVQFTDDFNSAWWWHTENDADWFIEANSIDDADPEDSDGSNPPGNGQPGQP
jgi:hypothetical protein